MIRHFLVSLFLSPLVSGLPTSTSSPLVTSISSSSPGLRTSSNCSDLSLEGCEKCLGQNGCYYELFNEGSGLCLEDGQEPQGQDIRVYHNLTECGGSGEDPDVTVPPPGPETTTKQDNTTTTTVSTTSTTTLTTTTIDTSTTTTVITTTTTENTTTTTTATTTTITPETTTTSSNTTTAAPTTTTTLTPTTTTTIVTTTTALNPNVTTSATPTSTAQPVPDSGRGHFDGWSFFGGILLTLGLAAIGLVGFKYYRLRSGTGGNYNRF